MISDPEWDGWMLPLDFVERVQSEIRQRKPSLIVECGSGRSTRMWAEAAVGYGGRVVSLEHDPDYHARTLTRLNGHAATVVLAPLQDGWYAPEAWSELGGVGMLVVDGPPCGTAKLARYPALPLLRDRLTDGALIVLDDTGREDEAVILGMWLAEFPGLRLVERVRYSCAEAALLEFAG